MRITFAVYSKRMRPKDTQKWRFGQILTPSKRKMMKRRIEIDAESKKFIERLFSFTRRMVDKGLYLHEQSELARKIQKVAMEKGGKVMVTLPECETIHTWDGKMQQVFPNGALLIIDKATGEYSVMHKGKAVKKGFVIEFVELDALQAEIAAFK